MYTIHCRAVQLTEVIFAVIQYIAVQHISLQFTEMQLSALQLIEVMQTGSQCIEL